MQKTTFRSFFDLFNATWPDNKSTKATFGAYWIALGHLDDDVFQQAATQCLRECTFYPKPAEILSRAERILTNAGVLPKEAPEAWNEVMHAVRSMGSERAHQYAFSSPDIPQLARECGGFVKIGTCDAERELPFLRKEFISRYEPLRKQRISDQPALMAQALPEAEPELPALDDGNDPRMYLLRDLS